MPFVSANGQITSNSPQSFFRLSIIPEIFLGLINLIILFGQTIIEPFTSKETSSRTDYRNSGQSRPPRPGGGGGPRPRMGGFRGGAGAPNSPPMMGGGWGR